MMIAGLAFTIRIVDQLLHTGSIAGAGVFFGFMSYVPGATYTAAASTELIYCAVGLFYGFITVKFRGAYENSVQKKEPAATDSNAQMSGE
jgi:hypothetical protein